MGHSFWSRVEDGEQLLILRDRWIFVFQIRTVAQEVGSLTLRLALNWNSENVLKFKLLILFIGLNCDQSQTFSFRAHLDQDLIAKNVTPST